MAEDLSFKRFLWSLFKRSIFEMIVWVFQFEQLNGQMPKKNGAICLRILSFMNLWTSLAESFKFIELWIYNDKFIFANFVHLNIKNFSSRVGLMFPRNTFLTEVQTMFEFLNSLQCLLRFSSFLKYFWFWPETQS